MPTQCPKCKATLPRRGQFCLDCGLDLYAEGLRHKPFPWLQVLAIPAVVGGVLAVLIIGPCKSSDTAPEIDTVVEQTKDFLRLVGEKDYAAAAERFLVANRARAGEVEEKLREAVRGAGAQGLKNAQSHGFRSLDETAAYVRKHTNRHPEYLAKLLYAVVSHGDPNPWLSAQRTERFLAWYLDQAFGGVDAAKAQLSTQDARWEDGVLTVRVRYPEEAAPPPGVADPSVLRWRLAGAAWGGCGKQRAVLDFGADDHLGDFLDLLKRLPAD
jgi:hypothetical protein